MKYYNIIFWLLNIILLISSAIDKNDMSIFYICIFCMLPIIYFAVFFAKQSDIKISKLEIALAYLWAPMIFQNLWFTPNLYSQAIALIGLGFALVAIYLKWKRVKSIKKMIVLNLNELEY